MSELESNEAMEFGPFEHGFEQWAREAVKAALVDPDSFVGRDHLQYLAGREADIKKQALALQTSESERSLADVTKIIMTRILERRIGRQDESQSEQLAA